MLGQVILFLIEVAGVATVQRLGLAHGAESVHNFATHAGPAVCSASLFDLTTCLVCKLHDPVSAPVRRLSSCFFPWFAPGVFDAPAPHQQEVMYAPDAYGGARANDTHAHPRPGYLSCPDPIVLFGVKLRV